ncbi:MAG: PSD1 and planctomycete cytochrome C domain-containing protein [Planctomycetota bacterium]|nr:PSD1 and planctomycete cytochrome C domain-containing protein [Planctomycetota bacterium]
MPTIFAFVAYSSIAATAYREEKVDFDREVRPILVANCYMCHGPHDEARKAGLRFDSHAGATAILRNGRHAIVPFNLDQSEILQRIAQTDIEQRMPPAGHDPLTPAQIATLRKWIQEGAVYTPPSAFQALRQTPPPNVKDQTWCESEIDRFVLATRERIGLAAPKTDLEPAALLRKLSFDVRGLPPDEQDVRAYSAQPTPANYHAIVDRYFADSAYGERWGRHWLDLARYAETLGHEFDYEMPDAWRYRDYVIDAMNHDLPLDQFVTEQIAGDLLPPRAAMNLPNVAPIATAWWFLGPAVHAPIDVRQDEADRIAGSIDVLGRSFFGLTVACARCHDHKFDPIPTADFYSLSGVVRNTRRVSGFVDTDPRAAGFLLSAIEAFNATQRSSDVDTNILATLRTRPEGQFLAVKAIDDLFDDGESWSVSGPAFAQGANNNRVISSPTAQSGTINSAKLDPRLVGSARSTTTTIDHRYLHIRLSGSDAIVRVIIDNYWLDERNALLFEGLLRRLPHQDPPSEWRTETLDLVRFKGERMYIELIDEGGGSIEVDWIAASDEPAPPDSESWDIDRISDAALAVDVASRTAAQDAIENLVACTAPMRAMIAEEGGNQDEPIHIRGASNSLGQAIPRARLQMLGAQSAETVEGSGRIALAQLLTDEKNPFLWRTTANRVWLKLFGRGIVETPDDFGQLGTPPWSAELLDALALQLMRERSIKSLIRTVVRSHAYRAAADSGESPSMAWSPLSVRRLDAESIRDSMLFASSRLDRTVGGASVPAYLTNHMQGRGRPGESGPVDGSGRRSLYLAVRRNFLDPFLQAFDAPVPSVTCGRRHSSNVPAQSLALMNSDLVRTISEHWAKQIVGEPESDKSRIESMWYALFSRPPRSDESEMALQFLDSERKLNSNTTDLLSRDRVAYAALAQSLFATKEFIFLR